MPIIGDAGNFRRGMDAQRIPLGSQPGGLAIAENAELYEDGSVGPVAGKRILNADSRLDDASNSPLPIDAGFTYQNGATEEVIVAADKLYKFDTSALTFTALAGGATNALTSGTPGSFFQFQDKLLYGNGTDRVKIYNGTTVTNMLWPEAASQAFKFKMFAEFNNRLYMAEGDAGSTQQARSRVYYSDLLTPDTADVGTAVTWYQEQYRTVGVSSKEAVTGLANAGSGRLIMFKRNMAEMLQGAGRNTWIEYKLFDTFGCLDHKTIANVNGHTVWLDEDGLRAFDGQSAPLIATQIQPVFRDLDRSRITNYQAIRFRSPWTGVEQYLLTVTARKDGTKNDTIIAGWFFPDGEIGWAKYTGFEARCCWNATRADGFESWMSGTSDGFVRRHDLAPNEPQDETTFSVTTHPMLGEDPLQEKQFGRLIYFYQTDIPVSLTVLHTVDTGKQERSYIDKMGLNVQEIVPLEYVWDKVPGEISYLDKSSFKHGEFHLKGLGLSSQIQLIHQGAQTNFRILRLLLEGKLTGGER
jgi:hypothetical protein